MRRNRQTSTQNSSSSSRRPRISEPILQPENSVSSQFGPLASVRDAGSSASSSARPEEAAEEQYSPSQEASTSSTPARRNTRRHGMLLSSTASASASGNQQPFRGNAEDSDKSTEFEEDFSSSYVEDSVFSDITSIHQDLNEETSIHVKLRSCSDYLTLAFSLVCGQ
ncbi:hypothetical protein I350_02597 [Cryptococcus amylolentus CBS 6273]|uniref:Uncharacterized protein n=1 Tax=Cryptococcus amylolentus CBS 6273 TaxID=1296118 RepID=A0A1E3K817_9TREE|nr:hypothetical protein I350_02597 [Cryptococcus amylolentus CBS 6273]